MRKRSTWCSQKKYQANPGTRRHRAAYHGRLTAATITEVRQSGKRNDRGVVSMTITVKNQKDETVLTYDQALLMAGAA